MIKLVALDIDGTLLNRQGIITDRTQRAIGTLRQQGVQVTLCTGRNMPLAAQFVRQLGLTLPFATCNGAEIRRLDGEVLERHPLPLVLTKQVYTILQKYDALYDIYSDDRIVIRNKQVHLERLIAYYRAVKSIDSEHEALLEQEMSQPYMFETHDIRDWLDRDEPVVEKFFVMENRMDILRTMFGELSQLSGLCVTTSHATTLEINHASADKGGALGTIAKACGLLPEEVAAVGDGMNDVSMFRYAGVSVAMGNASDEVKEQATMVTGPNTEEGLAAALEQWIV
jgi:Cof subfamily protein (haloacid dehalogenase superfamily)